MGKLQSTIERDLRNYVKQISQPSQKFINTQIILVQQKETCKFSLKP